MILTVDLGTSATKAVLWGADGVVTEGHSPLDTRFGSGGRVEQDPESWWVSVTDACRQVAATAGVSMADVEAVSFCAARQSFVPVTAGLRPLGPALLWNDGRAAAQARCLVDRFGGAATAKQQTGVALDARAVAAKVAWLAEHEPQRLAAARWLLAPRDLIVARLTGQVRTDPTLASATGCYDPHGTVLAPLAEVVGDRLPPVVSGDEPTPTLLPEPAASLSLRVGIPVVVGAGDRACEVLGSGADPTRPMVSWGTTANVSVPCIARADPLPDGLTTSRGALGGWLLEGGVAAAGSLLELLGRLTGTDTATLWASAATAAPGAHGLVVLPWPGGARAPWWNDDARAGLVGLGFHHSPADIARAAVEAVAFELARCLDEIEAVSPPASALTLAGGGARNPLWVEVVTAVTGLAAAVRRSGQAAAAGAALLAWRALGVDVTVDDFDPVVSEHRADPDLAACYRELRPTVDAAAEAVVRLNPADAADRAGAGGDG